MSASTRKLLFDMDAAAAVHARLHLGRALEVEIEDADSIGDDIQDILAGLRENFPDDTERDEFWMRFVSSLLELLERDANLDPCAVMDHVQEIIVGSQAQLN